MTPAQFIAKWSAAELSERAASQEHFIDLCRLLGQPTPAEHDSTGAEYAFEKGVAVTGGASKGAAGDRGFADVWWRNKFAWEYKRKDKYRSLTDAYRQLCQYRDHLENPPLLIVSDITRTEIRTNFTGTVQQAHTIDLTDLDQPESLAMLRRVFTNPESFRPTITPAKITEEIAAEVAKLSESIQHRGHEPHAAAHFLMKCMFCLFAEDVELLPGKLFSRVLAQWHYKEKELTVRLTDLFSQMRTGGAFGADPIPWFNGGLFDETPAIELRPGEVHRLREAAGRDWSQVEPAIFGTLFERSLDPGKRAQIGAHYTSRDDIMLIVEPVVMSPLRREWEQVKAECEAQLQRRHTATTTATKKKADAAISKALGDFQHRLASVTILDPACGSGNFLYVALQQLLNLEKEVVTFAARRELGLGGLIPQVRPTQLHGIEINPYAAELAQVVIWIGYLQWMRDNGFVAPSNPILDRLQTIENRDAILNLSDPSIPKPAVWPTADFIIGNPPFLGCRHFREAGIGEDYVQAMFTAYDLPKTSDLCCYWFELARRIIQERPTTRAGLLATQGIRGIDNREVLSRIKATGEMFMAWSDRSWVLDGADVRVSMVGFSAAGVETPHLDGAAVKQINADLSADADVAAAPSLAENTNLVFMGDTKGGPFEIECMEARRFACLPNPNGRPSTDVIRPWMNGGDLTKRNRGMFIIDFGDSTSRDVAAGYEAPFGAIEKRVKPDREHNRRETYAQRWWIHVEPRPALRAVIGGIDRFILTPRVAKHRLFAWADSRCLPDSRIFVFARADDYFFGVLHSAVHELWSLRTCAWHGVGNDPTYNTTTCFETFPLPWPPGKEPAGNPLVEAIAAAARELNEQRERWLNPPEWIGPIAASVDAQDDFADVPEPARPLIRQSAIMARAAQHPQLKKRTLTNLYNERPTWLRLAHKKLDQAVLAAYAAVDADGGWSPDWANVWEDTGAGQPLPADDAQAARRTEIDQKVLAALLRLNGLRSNT